MNEYEKRVLEGRKQFLRLTQQQEKELLEVYEEAAKRTVLKTLKAQSGTLTDRYLRELDKALVDYTKYLRANLDKVVKNTTKESAKIASNVQNTYMDMIAPTQDLKSSFNKMFTQLSDNVVKQLISGKYYEDGKTLDKRLWNITEKNGKDIDKLIKVNIAQGTNAKELAKELQQYINPDKPLTAKTFQDGIDKNVSYQARRLARTSLTHAHTESYNQGSKMNPFCKGLKWNLSSSHSSRMRGRTDICDERATQNEFGLGQGVFPANECPIQHCNCLCYFTQEVIDVNKARDELIDWLNGEDNSKLDNWLDEFGEEFGIEKNESKPFVKPDVKKSNINKWEDLNHEGKQFKNKKEIKKHLDENYNIKFSDSTKYPIDKDILQSSVNWLDKFHGYFKGFKEIDPVELPAFKVKASINPVGFYEYYERTPEAIQLVLNGAYFTDKEYTIRYVNECIKTEWTVANAQAHKTFVHEYGHHVANSLKWLDDKGTMKNSEWCKDFISETIDKFNDKFEDGITFKDMPKLVSRYGGTKPEEAFAETFAEYFGGENPRAFAKVFGELVEEKLKHYIKLKG